MEVLFDIQPKRLAEADDGRAIAPHAAADAVAADDALARRRAAVSRDMRKATVPPWRDRSDYQSLRQSRERRIGTLGQAQALFLRRPP